MAFQTKKQSIILDTNTSLYRQRVEQLGAIRSRLDKERTFVDKFADGVTKFFGSMAFFFLNTLWFVGWMLWNTGLIPGVVPFDPFPFGLLTMIVSLEAIFLSVFVLISQNRAEDIAEIREEVDLQINIRAEQEITKILILLDSIANKVGIDTKDDEVLHEMEQRLSTDGILDLMQKQLKGK